MAKNTFALGYVGLSYLNKDLKTLTVDGIEGTAENAMSSAYPVSRVLFMSEIAKPMVELLASLPSVVIGFFGMVAPFLQETFDIPTGLNLFNAALMLAFMSVPTICTISEDAIIAAEMAEAPFRGDHY